MKETRHHARSYSLVLKTMLVPAGYSVERWSYTLQRVTGVVVTLYFVLHVVETGNFVGGPGIWYVPSKEFAASYYEHVKELLHNPIFDAGLVIIGWMVAFHTINGVRLTLAHFGITLGKPARVDPESPPKSFSNFQRAIFWASIALATFAAVYSVDALFGVLSR
ncbi:MAG: hypothetical protein RMJ75_01060 [Nitrososphaerota archaeon]|nr:hypothetical protein [Nitrososphaerota archaeon]